MFDGGGSTAMLAVCVKKFPASTEGNSNLKQLICLRVYYCQTHLLRWETVDPKFFLGTNTGMGLKVSPLI